MGLAHESAMDLVKEKILNKLKLDEHRVAARYDSVIIAYANKYAVKYSNVDQQAYLRSHMRLLGKLLCSIR